MADDDTNLSDPSTYDLVPVDHTPQFSDAPTDPNNSIAPLATALNKAVPNFDPSDWRPSTNIEDVRNKPLWRKAIETITRKPLPGDLTNYASGGQVKATKTQANYRGGTKDKRCGLCSMFEPPHGCSSVKGVISPRGLCDYFERKEKRADGGSVDAKYKINRDYDVPYLAGSSDDDKTVYIDRRVPRKIAVKRANGKGYESIDPGEFLAPHEREEHMAMRAGKPYEKAHAENGAPAERALVKKHGLDWKGYEAVMNGLLSHIEHEHPKKPPPDLYTKPYPHREATLLKNLGHEKATRTETHHGHQVTEP